MVKAASVLNLAVHGVGPPRRDLTRQERFYWIDVARFDQLLDAVAGRSDVRLTFDDGNVSDVEIVLPRLRERGLVGEFFPLAGLLGRPGMLDPDGVRELCRAGMSVGLHGWAHRDWRRLGSHQVIEEYVDATRVLGELSGRPVTSVALPFGSYDRHVLRRLRGLGATRVYTCDRGRARADAWLQPRTSLRQDMTVAWLHRLLDNRFSPLHRLRCVAARLVKRARG